MRVRDRAFGGMKSLLSAKEVWTMVSSLFYAVDSKSSLKNLGNLNMFVLPDVEVRRRAGPRRHSNTSFPVWIVLASNVLPALAPALLPPRPAAVFAGASRTGPVSSIGNGYGDTQPRNPAHNKMITHSVSVSRHRGRSPHLAPLPHCDAPLPITYFIFVAHWIRGALFLVAAAFGVGHFFCTFSSSSLCDTQQGLLVPAPRDSSGLPMMILTRFGRRRITKGLSSLLSFVASRTSLGRWNEGELPVLCPWPSSLLLFQLRIRVVLPSLTASALLRVLLALLACVTAASNTRRRCLLLLNLLLRPFSDAPSSSFSMRRRRRWPTLN